jgi:hypothetical protein
VPATGVLRVAGRHAGGGQGGREPVCLGRLAGAVDADEGDGARPGGDHGGPRYRGAQKWDNAGVCQV